MLQLNADEKAKIQPLLDQANKDIQALRTDEANKAKAIHQKLHDQIKGVLTPEQQKKLDEIHAKAEAPAQGQAHPQGQPHAGPAGPGQPHHPGPGGPGGPGHNPDQVADEIAKNLGVSDDVKGKIKGIIEDSAKQGKVIFEDQALDREAKGAKLKALHEATEAKIKPLLTPEQQTKLDQWRAEHRHEGPHGQSGAHPQPPAQPNAATPAGADATPASAPQPAVAAVTQS